MIPSQRCKHRLPGSGWEHDKSMSSIGRVFDRQSSYVFSVISPTGGIRPPESVRSHLAFTLIEREEISRGLIANQALQSIARNLGLAASTISREVRRTGGVENYRAAQSGAVAWDRALRPKPCKLADNDYLCRVISAKLYCKWSPQQIAGWLMRKHPDDGSNTKVSLFRHAVYLRRNYRRTYG